MAQKKNGKDVMNNPKFGGVIRDQAEEAGVRGSEHAGQSSQSGAPGTEPREGFQPSRKGSSGQNEGDLTSEQTEKELDVHLEDAVDEDERDAASA